LVFKKCREHPDNLLFIDASQHYEKVKTQNILHDEDVDRIVDTYSNRTTTDKYSYVASLDEIRNNDYNLNISRYVATFEEEESVDIKIIASELRVLDDEMKTTDETIAGFCKELKIQAPF
jgi:type I restriction enzyme M protein